LKVEKSRWGVKQEQKWGDGNDVCDKKCKNVGASMLFL
jgi:hypothetical protein